MSDLCKDNEMSRLLHAYELGMIADDDKDRFEAHLLECDVCFNHVKEFLPRGALLSASPEIKKLLETSDRESTAAVSMWQRLRRSLWPDAVPPVLKPAVLLTVLLLMLYPAYLGLFDDQGYEVTSVQEIGLVQARSRQTFVIQSDQDVVLSFVCPDRLAGQTYSIVLQGPDGTVIHEDKSFSQVDNFMVGRLLLGAGLMSEGDYRLSVRTNDIVPDEQSAIEYMFGVTHRTGDTN